MSRKADHLYGQWGRQISPGLEKPWQVGRHRIVITNISLPHVLKDEGRSTVALNYVRSDLDDDVPSSQELTACVTLATLVPKAVETVAVNITLNRTESIAFEVFGNNTIHLSGYYIGLFNVTEPVQLENLFDAPIPSGSFLSSASTSRRGKARASDNHAGPSNSGKGKRKARDEDEDENEDRVVTAKSKKPKATR
ncbi:hypothetical protein BDZ89DRAFT_1147700 [Hymenopellis radicata]|nr:hypothetical protein BDZ89DRAFT_1147700 [Hymenopellis radicata]